MLQLAQLFGENFARTNKYMRANRLWLHTVPTQDCEVVVIFPAKAGDSVLMWVLARLKERLPELLVAVRNHAHTGTCGLYLSASFERELQVSIIAPSSSCVYSLLKGAESLSIRKPLKTEYGGGLKEFTCLEASMFEGIDDQEEFLSSQERQAIINHMLENLRAVEGDKLGKVKFVDNEPIVPKLQAKGVVSKVFPLHKQEDLKILKKTWVQAFFKPQPLDAVCDYFGVKIAMYFAWLGHYTQALVFPAIFGLLVTLYVDEEDQVSQDRSVVFFSIFNIIWASLHLEVWKRKGAALAYQWGTMDSKHELIEEPRPQYKGDLVVSAVSGKLQPYYPSWKRNVFRYFVTLPVIILCCSITFVSMYLIVEFQEWVNLHIDQGSCPSWVGYIPKIILTGSISISDVFFKRVARWLNRMENYRLQSMHENQLILKLVTVQFINHFLHLFYIAFVLQDMTRLRKTLATVFILRQLTGNLKESVLPYVTETLKVYQMTYQTASKVERTLSETSSTAGDDKLDSPDQERETTSPEERKSSTSSDEEKFTITQAELESVMKSYEDTFDDYLEMLIQFGYVILFSSAFPMAGMCALINNIIEIRSDAFKLCSSMHRPFGQRVENIGSWQQALEVMGILGVIVNCALLGTFGQVGRAFPSLTPFGVLMFVVVLEHVILAVKMAISMGIPDIPYWVSIEMAKLEYNRREALKKMELAALHCAKEGKAKESSTGKDREEGTKKDDGGTGAGAAPKLKRPQPGKVWPSSMTEAAANFKLFEKAGKSDKAVSTSDLEDWQTGAHQEVDAGDSAPVEKSEQEKKVD
ncbi:anoctamin-8-like [Diadema antillarum]|uniref:anoctamin-8-like n=1 Tax=Diadema antillarum TaxID=105358 RepID=UPI003A86100E